VRVSHEFLLHAHGCSGFVQPSTVGMAERVEPDPAKSQLKTCRNQVVGTNRIGVIRPIGHRTREQPSPVITENLVCMPTLSAEENDRGGLEVAERRVLDRKAGSAKRNPVSAREEIALVNTTNGSYSRRSTD